jgi:putative ABC transport system substrate-binding protein
MALSRRRFLVAVPLTGLGAACAGSTHAGGRPVATGTVEVAMSTPTGAAKGTILVAMPETVQTGEVWSGLEDELGQDYRLVAVRVEGSSAASDLATAMVRHRPNGVVLMNNPTVAAYRAYQEQSGLKQFPPAVVVMTSFFDGRPSVIAGATGISYEAPLITAVTNLRKVVAMPIERIGVVVRPSLRGYVQRQAALATREQITVITQEVGASPNASEVKWALRKLKGRIDALWVLNDDHLLTPRLITDGWLPGLNERPYAPTIVGAAALVSPRQSFGTFAVLPDHTALGVQAADILFNLAENNWILPPDAQVQLPLSTTTTLDLVQVRDRFSLRPDALQHVDRILE